MFDGAVRVTQRVAIAIPTITDDHRAWVDPFMYKSCRRFCPVQEQEVFCRTLVQHRQTSLTLNRVPSIVLSLTELGLINLDGLVRTPDFSDLPSKNLSIVSLQNMPQSATVWSLRLCSFPIWIA
jgi:hypothetical protein